MKLFAFGTWNEEEMCYDFAGHIIAQNKHLAQIKAEIEFQEDDCDCWEVKVDGYKIEVKED